MKVDFMIIGAMKCGTSTMAKILADHQQVSFCERKEPHFFSKTKDWRANLDAYHKMFRQKEGVIYGEGSTSYTFAPQLNPAVWEDIHDYNPDTKFIYMVRNPIDRMISQYVHMYEKGFFKYDLETAINKYAGFINNGRYFTQIAPYIEKFGADQVLIVDFDEFNADRKKVLQQVTDFLSIDECTDTREGLHENKSIGAYKMNHKLEKFLKKISGFVPVSTKEKINKKLFSGRGSKLKEKPVLSKKKRTALLELFKLDIRELEKLSQKDYSHWLDA